MKIFNKKKVVNPKFAKNDEYGEIINIIEKEGKCPFCSNNFKYHKHPILKRQCDWFITKISWPYKNTEHHFLIISDFHKEQLSELNNNDLKNVNFLMNWAIEEFGIKGGALTLRFGDTEYTGATVCHIHFHLIAPKASKTVNFPIG